MHYLAYRSIALLLLFSVSSPAQAWNALGHKLICHIAWEQIDQVKRDEIVATLRRHPRFDDDFAKQEMPAEDVERWIFWTAGTWPDIARGIRGPDRNDFHRATWHYVNYPLFIGPNRKVSANLSVKPTGDSDNWNVSQALKYSLKVLDGDAPPKQKALAYCWVFHLVGDLHQPLHSTALFCDRFPDGDRGGNSIKTKQGRNLHSLWDNLLGRRHYPNDVLKEYAELKANNQLWEVDLSGNVDDWIAESHEVAKSYVYSDQIKEAVGAEGELQPVSLSKAYLKGAGRVAEQRVVAAGLRLGAVLSVSKKDK